VLFHSAGRSSISKMNNSVSNCSDCVIEVSFNLSASFGFPRTTGRGREVFQQRLSYFSTRARQPGSL
jgi:hypothetical protein